jgi:hypothetical protein
VVSVTSTFLSAALNEGITFFHRVIGAIISFFGAVFMGIFRAPEWGSVMPGGALIMARSGGVHRGLRPKSQKITIGFWALSIMDIGARAPVTFCENKNVTGADRVWCQLPAYRRSHLDLGFWADFCREVGGKNLCAPDIAS